MGRCHWTEAGPSEQLRRHGLRRRMREPLGAFVVVGLVRAQYWLCSHGAMYVWAKCVWALGDHTSGSLRVYTAFRYECLNIGSGDALFAPCPSWALRP